MPDRIRAPEGWLRGGFFHVWRDPWGLKSGGSTPSISPAQSAGGVCPTLRPGPTPSEVPSRPCASWGHRREDEGEQERQAGGALQYRRSGR